MSEQGAYHLYTHISMSYVTYTYMYIHAWIHIANIHNSESFDRAED